MAEEPVDIRDPGFIYRFGNLTSSSVSEVLASARPYNEPASEAQRSVKSSSANDSDPSGSGAKKVLITYLNSSYIRKTEEVALNGTTAVNTVATDIRFIENFEVSKGATAAGAIELFPNTGGTGTAICGIGVATEQAFFPHHYVPAGNMCYVLDWGATSDDEISLKLKAQARPNGVDLVDTNIDLEKQFNGNATPPTRLEFLRKFGGGVVLSEKTYLRITVVPNQATSTVIRTRFTIWENVAA